jgi:hypothetical protein
MYETSGYWEGDIQRLGGELYEVAMRYPGGTVMRLTDRLPEVGETVQGQGKWWEVVGLERDQQDVRETARFVCHLTHSQHERAMTMREENTARQLRSAALLERAYALLRRVRHGSATG